MRLVCFGDSICYGYAARPGEGWVARLARQLTALPRPVTVINAGINGDTSADGLVRMRRDVERHHPDAVYVQFGLNDCSTWGSEHPLVDERHFTANILQIIARSFHCGAHAVFLATNHPVGNNPFGETGYSERVTAYNAALRNTFFDLRGVVGIDIERHVRTSCPDPDRLVLSDGVHLSRAGNEFYRATVAEYIMQYLSDKEKTLL